MDLARLKLGLVPFFTQQLYSDETEMHIFIAWKAPWDYIGGPAPQFAEHADSNTAGANSDA
jgi:hypothetical protein